MAPPHEPETGEGRGRLQRPRAENMSSHDDRRPRGYRPATLHRASRLSCKRLALSTPETSIQPVEPLAPWLCGKRNLE